MKIRATTTVSVEWEVAEGAELPSDLQVKAHLNEAFNADVNEEDFGQLPNLEGKALGWNEWTIEQIEN